MILYKYIGHDSGLRMIESQTLGFRPPSFFNDPFEISTAYAPPSSTGVENFFDQIRLTAKTSMLRDNHAILSLTRSPNNPLMWAHYGDQHKGWVIGFEVNSELFTAYDKNTVPVQHGSVIYTATWPTHEFMKLPVLRRFILADSKPSIHCTSSGCSALFSTSRRCGPTRKRSASSSVALAWRPRWQVSAFAEFFDVPEASESAICGVEVDALTGIDDCGVRWYGGLGWGGGDVQPRSVGPATLLGPGWTEPMVMGLSPQKYYDADILGSGHPAGWGEAYGITWTGERLPAGELPQFVTLPAELKITAPAGVSWTFGDGPFELAWTGTGAAPLRLVAQFAGSEGNTTWFELVCKIADDGSFVVPAEVVALLPPGSSGLGGLRRATATTAEAAGRTIVGVAAVAIDLEVAVAP